METETILVVVMIAGLVIFALGVIAKEIKKEQKEFPSAHKERGQETPPPQLNGLQTVAYTLVIIFVIWFFANVLIQTFLS